MENACSEGIGGIRGSREGEITNYKAILIIGFSISLTIPLLPYLVNGAPFIGDSWVHISIADDVVETGTYQLSEYSTRWFSLNILMAVLRMILNTSSITTGIIAPLAAGLATVPFYCIMRRLNLSTTSSILGVLILSFNPLYTYITFSGAVMRETEAFYLLVCILLITFIVNGKRLAPVAWIIGIGLIFAHHYSSLVILIYLLTLYVLGYFEVRDRGNEAYISIVFLPVFLIWNLFNYVTLGKFFPALDLQGGLLLISIVILSLAVMSTGRGFFRVPILPALAFLFAFLGLRDNLFLLLRKEPPISIFEVRDMLLLGSVFLVGTYLGVRNRRVRALAVTTTALVLFSVMYSTTASGFTLMIKSLHYFGIIIAIGSAILFSKIVNRKYLGKVVIFLVIIVTLVSSSYGTDLALRGLGAYHKGEIIGCEEITRIPTDLRLIGDTKASYLFNYYLNYDIGGLRGSGALLVLRGNDIGFLIGYDWIPAKAILSKMGRINKILDFKYVKIISSVGG